MQITMFLTLGLLVFPTEIPPIITNGLLIAIILIFIARPVSIFLTLLPTGFSLKEKLFLSWVGLRGAVPIILATYPLLAGLSQADSIFNIVFFVVLTSALLQGASIPFVAKWLNVDIPVTKKPVYPIEFNPVSGFKSELKELTIPKDSPASGKTILDLHLPEEFLIILIARDNEFIMPSGGIDLRAGDTLIVLSNKDAFDYAERELKPKH